MAKNFLFQVSTVGLGLLAALLISETVFRLVGPEPSIVPIIYDKDVGALNQPGYSDIYSKEGVSHFSINSEGWRDIERTAKKPNGVYRVAIVGNSYIEALQVERESMITSKLESILNSTNSSHHYEVIPFGMSGADAAVALQVIRHKVIKYNPDLVVYGFSPSNTGGSIRVLKNIPYKPYYTLTEKDELKLDDSFKEYILRTKQGFPRKFHVFARGESRLYSYLVYRTFPQVKLWLNKPKKFSEPLNSKNTIKKRAKAKPALIGESYADDPPKGNYKLAWTITEQLMLAMKRLCESKNIKFMVLGITNSSQVQINNELDVPGYVYYPEKRLADFSEKNNMYYFPLTQKFYSIHKGKGVIFHGTKEKPGGHWRESGHEYGAKFLAEFMGKNNILPN